MSSVKLSRELPLNDGTKIPIVGLGTFQSTDENKLVDVIIEAYNLGYRHFDTAWLYKNEHIMGKAFKALFDRGVKREDLYITSKMFPIKGVSVVDTLKQSLKDLNIEYVDLYLVHWAWYFPKKENDKIILTHKPVHQVWAEFEECKDLGLTKSIGVSNFNQSLIIDLLSYCKHKPVLNQVELHPCLPLKGLVETCRLFDIEIEAYSSLMRGGADQKSVLGQRPDILNNEIVVKMAKKYNKSPAQILLNYATSLNIVVIPKTENVKRLKENFEVHDWFMSKEDIAELETLSCNLRTIDSKLQEVFQYIEYF